MSIAMWEEIINAHASDDCLNLGRKVQGVEQLRLEVV